MYATAKKNVFDGHIRARPEIFTKPPRQWPRASNSGQQMSENRQFPGNSSLC
jgi:hypothetical protein